MLNDEDDELLLLLSGSPTEERLDPLELPLLYDDDVRMVGHVA